MSEGAGYVPEKKRLKRFRVCASDISISVRRERQIRLRDKREYLLLI